MAATSRFKLAVPTNYDLDAAQAAWRDGRIAHQLPARSFFFRVLRAIPPASPLAYARTCWPSEANSRFSPIRAHGNIIPSAYAATTRELALWETILRDIRHQGIKRVPQREISNRYLVEVRTTRARTLLDIRRPKDANLVAGRKRPPKLSVAPKAGYVITREWAQRLYERIPEIDGLIYESHQVSGDCIVLFQPTDLVVFEPVDGETPVNREPIRTLLRSEAHKAGAVVDFGHLPDP
jgi:hypothetical protein